MSTTTTSTPLLLAPGPTELSPTVRTTLSLSPVESHFSTPFASTFSQALHQLRPLFLSTNPLDQPFVLSGSGTLGWDFAATSFWAEGDKVLCLDTGFFSEAFHDCVRVYGGDVTVLKAERPGRGVDVEAVERELARQGGYRAVVVTHVDTSTGVLMDLKRVAEAVRRVSPQTLIVVDAVASLVAEELRFSEWGLDVVLTGSQKALSCPPGLSVVMVSQRALEVSESREGRELAWYASLRRWLPVMRRYEEAGTAYFATPATQLVHALKVAVGEVLEVGMEEVWRRHREKSELVKAVVEGLGMRQMPERVEEQANGLTAFWLPEGLTKEELLGGVLKKGVMLSAGMHKEVGTKYVRFGHMGYSAFGGVDHVQRGCDALVEVMEAWYKARKEDEEGDSGYASSNSS